MSSLETLFFHLILSVGRTPSNHTRKIGPNLQANIERRREMEFIISSNVSQPKKKYGKTNTLSKLSLAESSSSHKQRPIFSHRTLLNISHHSYYYYYNYWYHTSNLLPLNCSFLSPLYMIISLINVETIILLLTLQLLLLIFYNYYYCYR